MKIVITPYPQSWGPYKGQIFYHASVRAAGQGYYLAGYSTRQKAEALAPGLLAKMKAHPSNSFKRFLNNIKAEK